MSTNSLVGKALQEQMNGVLKEWLKRIRFLLKYLGMERVLQLVKEVSFNQFQEERE